MPDLVVACALACVHSTILSILILREFVKRGPGSFFGLGACRVIKVKVPELMKAKGYNATDLMRHANIAYGTAGSPLRDFPRGADCDCFRANSLAEGRTPGEKYLLGAG